jgi:hypothetical protein
MKRNLHLSAFCCLLVLLFAGGASGADNYRSLQGVNCQLRASEMQWDADGFMEGQGVKLICEETPVELISGKASKGWLETKDFGKIRLRNTGGFGIDILVTPQQNDKFKKAFKK